MEKEGATINPPLSWEEKLKWASLLGEPLAERVKRGEEMGLPYKQLAKRYLELVEEKTDWTFPKRWAIE